MGRLGPKACQLETVDLGQEKLQSLDWLVKQRLKAVLIHYTFGGRDRIDQKIIC